MSNTDFNQPEPGPQPPPQQQPEPPPQAQSQAAQPREASLNLSPEDQPKTRAPPVPANVAPFVGPAVNQPWGTTPDPGWTRHPVAFIPPSPNRPPSQLGQPWWPVQAAQGYPGPAPSDQFMPAPQDSYKVMGEAGQRLAMWTPPSVAGPASRVSEMAAGFAPLIDAVTSGRFSQAYSHANLLQVQKQMGRLKIQQEMMLQQAEAAQQAHAALLTQYGSIFKLADDHAISPEEATERIRQLAMINGDSGVVQELNTRGLKGAAGFLQWQDAEMRKLWVGATALSKATRSGDKEETDDRIGQQWGEATGGDTSHGRGGAWNFSNLPGAAGEQVANMPSARETDAPETEPSSDFDQKLQKENGLTPQQIEAVHQIYNGDSSPAYDNLEKGSETPMKAMIRSKIGQGYQRLSHEVNSIANDTTPDDPDNPENAKLERIRALDKGAAQTIEGFRTYALDPKDTNIKRRLEMLRLTQAVYPNYRQSYYDTYKKIQDPNSQEGFRIQAANRVGSQAVPLLAAINSLPIAEDATIPQTVWADWLAKGYTNDPVYSRLNETIGAFARESIATQTGSRGGAVSYVNQMMKGLNLHEGKAALRAVVRDSITGTNNIIDTHNAAFQRESGLDRDIPGFDPHTKELFNGIARGNPYTGKFAKDAPIELQEVAADKLSDPKYRKTRPAWMTKQQDWEPMTQQEFQSKENFVKQLMATNPSDPRIPIFLRGLGQMR